MSHLAEPNSTVPDPSRATASSATAWARYLHGLPVVALACAWMVVWIVQHPYYGLVHDSVIYLIQALARLNPSEFSADIFLRYGSQDRYTVFGPVFAQGMRWFGIENAAAVFSLVANAGFFAAITVLARSVLPKQLVWLSVALVCAVPAFYGPGRIFAVVEDFATPRLFAETLVVLALAAFLKRRFWLAAPLGLVAMALHPLMTAGGILVALLSSTTPPRVRAWTLATGALAAAVLLGWMSAQGLQVRFDEAWLHLIRIGATYLWLSEWSLLTWSPVIVSLTTLTIGLLVLERSHARSLARASIIAAAGGIALNYVAGDLLHVVLVVQAQPYRVLWLSTLMSLLLLPLVLHRAWARGAYGRAAALLLVAAWLCAPEPYAIGVAALAFGASVATMRNTDALPDRTRKLMVFGAASVLALAAVYHVATTLLFTAIEDSSEVPRFLQEVRAFSRTGALPYALFVLIFLAVRRYSSWVPRVSIAAGCVTLLAVLAPFSAHEWTIRRYSDHYDAFAGWRALIPPRAEVLWFDWPIGAWMLLQRPSYLSNTQEVSGVFSRSAAMVMKHRVDMLEPYLSTVSGAALRDPRAEDEAAARTNDPVSLRALCASAPDLNFIVTSKNMLAEPLATTPRGVSARYRTQKLYRCEQAHE